MKSEKMTPKGWNFLNFLLTTAL